MNHFLKSFTLFFLLLTAPLFCACGNDDEEPIEEVDVSTFILGKWHTYKATANSGQTSATQSISKDGILSEAYLEVEFLTDSKAYVSGWVVDENNISSWVTEEGTFSVAGNSVKVTSDGDTFTLTFDQKSRELYLRGYVTDEYSGNIAVFIYFKKK